jgi:precorrin-6A/cobalt-precorrin-6A reductase
MKEVSYTILLSPMSIGKVNTMNKLYFCIFGGTTEGRLLAEFLSNNHIKIDLYVATEYAEQFVEEIDNISVFQKRLDKDEMIMLFKDKAYSHVIDATHPFAKIVSQNIVEASEHSNIKYVRIIRESKNYENCTYVNSMQSAVALLNEESGNVLLTTGSKDLELFTQVHNYKERIYPRILPMEDSLKKAIELGYSNKNIICMQGPFSTALNEAMINSINATSLVTKESLASGGLEEKVKACEKSGCRCIVVRKPLETGCTLEEIKALIEKDMI